jgi:hypothetical protein
MYPTHLRFPKDGRSVIMLDLTITPIEFIPSESWKTGYSVNKSEDGYASSLDSYWIDFGGEG